MSFPPPNRPRTDDAMYQLGRGCAVVLVVCVAIICIASTIWLVNLALR